MHIKPKMEFSQTKEIEVILEDEKQTIQVCQLSAE